MSEQHNDTSLPAVLTDADRAAANMIANNLVADRNKVLTLEKEVSSLKERLKMVELERDHAIKNLIASELRTEGFRTATGEALIQRASIETQMFCLLESARDHTRAIETLCQKLQPIPLMKNEDRAGLIQVDPRTKQAIKEVDSLKHMVEEAQ